MQFLLQVVHFGLRLVNFVDFFHCIVLLGVLFNYLLQLFDKLGVVGVVLLSLPLDRVD